jgi:hypothetical protein
MERDLDMVLFSLELTQQVASFRVLRSHEIGMCSLLLLFLHIVYCYYFVRCFATSSDSWIICFPQALFVHLASSPFLIDCGIVTDFSSSYSYHPSPFSLPLIVPCPYYPYPMLSVP